MNLRDLVDQGFGLHNDQRGCRVEEGLGQDSFVRTNQTFLGPDGVPVTIETNRLYRLGCGHVVGAVGSEELLGRCGMCGVLLCFRCEARCAGCAEVLCPKCRRELDGTVYCKKCKRKERVKRFFGFILRDVHDGLSK